MVQQSIDVASQFGLSELRGDLGKKEDPGETLLLDGKGTILDGEISMEDAEKPPERQSERI